MKALVSSHWATEINISQESAPRWAIQEVCYNYLMILFWLTLFHLVVHTVARTCASHRSSGYAGAGGCSGWSPV
jgi:hypothetical protein